MKNVKFIAENLVHGLIERLELTFTEISHIC